MIKAFSVVAAAGVIVFSGPAQALNTRTWISGTGVDQAGCGPIANPCRSLQYAHDNTSAGGEIDVKDSAGYGNLTITKAISIVGDGTIAGVLAGAGTNAITVNAGRSDKIVLRGLTIEGAGVALNGIVFNSGGVLDIADCVIQNFVGAAPSNGNGVYFQPLSNTSAIVVTNSHISHNAGVGLYFVPVASAVASIAVDRVTAVDNQFGIVLNGGNTSGATVATVANSITAKNESGIDITGTKANIDLCQSVENSGNGFTVYPGGSLTIGRSNGADNGATGLFNEGGTIWSYKDNRFAGNGVSETSGTIGVATLF